MANTITYVGKSVMITGLDADFAFTDLADYLEKSPCVSIEFNPSGGDTFQVRHGGASGPVIMKVKCSGDTDQRIKYFPASAKIRPHIVISECAFVSAGSAQVLLQFE